MQKVSAHLSRAAIARGEITAEAFELEEKADTAAKEGAKTYLLPECITRRNTPEAADAYSTYL